MKINIQTDLRESIERLMTVTSSHDEPTTQYQIMMALENPTVIDCIKANIQQQRLIGSYPEDGYHGQ